MVIQLIYIFCYCHPTLTGELQMSFYQCWHILRKVELLNKDHPVLWLFENALSLGTKARRVASHFLEVSYHRTRCYLNVIKTHSHCYLSI